jgi:hypothetical protein
MLMGPYGLALRWAVFVFNSISIDKIEQDLYWYTGAWPLIALLFQLRVFNF